LKDIHPQTRDLRVEEENNERSRGQRRVKAVANENLVKPDIKNNLLSRVWLLFY